MYVKQVSALYQVFWTKLKFALSCIYVKFTSCMCLLVQNLIVDSVMQKHESAFIHQKFLEFWFVNSFCMFFCMYLLVIFFSSTTSLLIIVQFKNKTYKTCPLNRFLAEAEASHSSTNETLASGEKWMENIWLNHHRYLLVWF